MWRTLILTAFAGVILIKIYGYAVLNVPDVEQVKPNGKNFEILDAGIDNLILDGSSANNSSYTLKAKRGEQVGDNICFLHLVDGIYRPAHLQDVRILAHHGLIDKNINTVYLEGKIGVSSLDYKIQSDKMEINFDASYFQAQDNVQIDYGNSLIKSNKCRVFNNQQNIQCHGKVRATITLNSL